MKTVSVMTPQFLDLDSIKQKVYPWIVTMFVITISLLLCISLWAKLQSRKLLEPKNVGVEKPLDSGKSAPSGSSSSQILLSEPANLSSSISMVKVRNEAPVNILSVGASVEANHSRVQQITPLAIGRVKDVLVSTGDKVKKGDLLLVIESPQIAEMHGKLHEAETRASLAKSQLDRVRQSANQVNILKAKATLDEADATVKRNRLLVAEGAATRKDLLASESEFTRATAEYQFQKDINLNREVAQAESELSTAQTEVEHLRDGLKVLDGYVNPKTEGNDHDIARIELRSPISGTVIEKYVNPGTGVDTGKTLLTIADTSGIWVVARVPEKQMNQIFDGMSARILIEGKTYNGKVNFIDPRMDEDTRTARVRLEISDLKEPVNTGTFAQVEFSRRDSDKRAKAFIPESAIQDIDGSTYVFVKNNNTEQFQLRKVEIGPRCCNLIPIYKGLSVGEVIAGNGSFILKSQVLKGKLGGSD